MLDEEKIEGRFYPTVFSLWFDLEDEEPERVLVDIPIGFADSTSERRRCDAEGEGLLGGRVGSIFYTPTREAVYSTNLEEARELYEDEDIGISSQAWALVPRIREVDGLLESHAKAGERIQETHPEVCFAGLNGGKPMENKKDTDEGSRERKEILRGYLDEHPTDGEDPIDELVDEFTVPEYAPMARENDILDAAAAAVAAREMEDRSLRIPNERNEGEPEIVYTGEEIQH